MRGREHHRTGRDGDGARAKVPAGNLSRCREATAVRNAARNAHTARCATSPRVVFDRADSIHGLFFTHFPMQNLHYLCPLRKSWQPRLLRSNIVECIAPRKPPSLPALDAYYFPVDAPSPLFLPLSVSNPNSPEAMPPPTGGALLDPAGPERTLFSFFSFSILRLWNASCLSMRAFRSLFSASMWRSSTLSCFIEASYNEKYTHTHKHTHTRTRKNMDERTTFWLISSHHSHTTAEGSTRHQLQSCARMTCACKTIVGKRSANQTEPQLNRGGGARRQGGRTPRRAGRTRL